MENVPVIPSFWGKALTAEQALEKALRGDSAVEHIPDSLKESLQDLKYHYGTENLIYYLDPSSIPEDIRKNPSEFFLSTQEEIRASFSDLEFFYPKNDWLQYLRQEAALDDRKKRFDDCHAKNWPKPAKPPSATTLTPQGVSDWPGISMEKIDKPSPTGVANRPAPPPDKTLRLTMAFGIKQGVPYNAMDLYLWGEEVLE